MEPHPHGWLSLLPPLVAILLAVLTRRVVLSLVVGILSGALVARGGDLWSAIHDTWEIHLWTTLIEPGKLRVFSFTLLMGATIGVINRAGGMHGLVDLMTPLARTRRGGQIITWLLGHLIFFDDYANTLLLGHTLRPLFDKLRVSREKLAYLVDCTSAPVAGLAIVSTWIAVEIEFIAEGLRSLPATANLRAFDLFLASIPYRFYILMALVLVALIAFSGRDFGPMLRVERKRLKATEEEMGYRMQIAGESDAARPHRWYNAVIPILAILVVVVFLIIRTGEAALAAASPTVLAENATSDVEAATSVSRWEYLRTVIGKGDSSLALQYGALLGLILASLLALMQKLLTVDQVLEAAGRGARLVVPALLILWCASTLSRMTGHESYDGRTSDQAYAFRDHRLYTGEYLKGLLLQDNQDQHDAEDVPSKNATSRIPAWLIPTVVFLLASAIAFCTGTSWGTMGILMPMVVVLAYAVVEPTAPDGAAAAHPIFLCCIGGVLAGAVFGDHCSPISDTTVLSSQSSGCDHIAHVWTQMPYAIVVAVVNILFGTLMIGLGMSVWVALLLQVACVAVMLLIVGRTAVEA